MNNEQVAIQESLDLDLGIPNLETPSDFFDHYDEMIQRVARQEHKASTLFERDDLEQEVRLACLREIDTLLEADENFVKFFCRRAAKNYALHERLDWEQFTGAFVYTPDIVKAQLESGAWGQGPEGDWAIRLDVREAWQQLPSGTQVLIYRTYGMGHALDPAQRKTVQRGIDRIARILNSETPYLLADFDSLLGREAV